MDHLLVYNASPTEARRALVVNISYQHPPVEGEIKLVSMYNTTMHYDGHGHAHGDGYLEGERRGDQRAQSQHGVGPVVGRGHAEESHHAAGGEDLQEGGR